MKAATTLTAAIRASTAPIALAAAALAAAATPAAAQSATAADQRTDFDIPAQPLSSALLEYSRQTGIPVAVDPARVEGKRARAIKGRHTPTDALLRMVAGSGLAPQRQAQGGFTLVEARGESGGAESGADDASEIARGKGISEILVVGSTTQNVDIRRNENDPQPYVVFNSKDIDQSQASSLEDFLRKRLSMVSSQSASIQGSSSGQSLASSQISLRGLSPEQTLILVDGRRVPRAPLIATANAAPTQADISGIPLSSIERIEVLPSTAGSIYGGGAVGGVINIIRKRNYRSVDMRMSYAQPFRGGGSSFRAETNGGFAIENDRTQIAFGASYEKTSPLYGSDNDLTLRGRRLLNANVPNDGVFTFAGTTPNIRSVTGGVLTLDPVYGGASLGSNHTFVPVGFRGSSLDGVVGLVSNAGKYNIELSRDAMGRQLTVRNGPEVISGNFNIRREFTRQIDAFVDVNMNKVRGRSYVLGSPNSVILLADTKNNPFQQDIRVFLPFEGLEVPYVNRSMQFSFTGGMIARFYRDWTATAEYQWSKARISSRTTNASISASGFTSLSNGSIDIIRDPQVSPIDLAPFRQYSLDQEFGPQEINQRLASLRIAGSVLQLPGGRLKLTALAEHRDERSPNYLSIGGASVFGTPGGASSFPSATNITPDRSQVVTTGYVELRAPMFSAANSLPLISELELQGSLRHDQYSNKGFNRGSWISTSPPLDLAAVRDKFVSTNFTVAALWTPISGVRLRASYGTGFLPPAISQMSSLPPSLLTLPATTSLDPLRANQALGAGYLPVTIFRGGNPNLKPESSKSFSAGLVVEPTFAPKLRISVDYTRIRKSDEIRSLDTNTAIANEEYLPGRIVRAPLTSSDIALGYTGGAIQSIDTSSVNLASTVVEAWDYTGSYELGLGNLGNLIVYASATRQTKFSRQLLPTSLRFDTVGYVDGPLKWRGSAGLEWNRKGLTVSWNAQYFHGYSVEFGSNPTTSSTIALNATRIVQQGARLIPSQTYHDMLISYSVGDEIAHLKGSKLSFGVQNLFDRKPPVIAQSFNGYSGYGDPRLRRFTLTVNKQF